MPGLNKTGPLGQGSQTGRKMGRCRPENENSVEDLPRGRCGGRGFRKKQRFEGALNVQGDGTNLGRGRGRGRRRN